MMINKKLKLAMYEKEVTHKDVSASMGINTKVFTNKINKRVVNGYEARFTDAEKVWLADAFGVAVSDIE